MAASLRDELASLKIDRCEIARGPDHGRATRPRGEPSHRERRGPLGLMNLILWLLPLGLLAGAGFYGYRQYQRLRARVEVVVAPVQAMTAGEAEKLLSAKGYIKSRSQAMIGAKVPGRVEQMLVDEGSRVEKDQLLAVLEHNDIRAMFASRQAQVTRAEAELREAEVDLRERDRRVRREHMLRVQGRSSPELEEQALAERDMASARAEALRAGIELMSASAREAEETIRNMHILAPFAGTVVSKQAEVGETITPGGLGEASGRGSVVTLADLEHLEVETDVAEQALARIHPGQPAEITVSAVPGRRYRGRLRQIVPMGDRARGTVKVDVDVLDPDDRLFPELVATVHFLPDEAVDRASTGQNFLFVPVSALLGAGDEAAVWVVDAQSQARKRMVRVAERDGNLARIDAGLEPGESVVLDPAAELRDGEPVQVAD